MTIEIPLSPRPRVSVIIPATASLEMLLAALRSLSQHAPRGIPFETIVVLHDSMAGEEAHLHERVVGVRVIRSTVNLGLAGAGNRGRSVAKGDFLMLLHDDAEIEPGWLEALVRAADTHPEAGAIGGKVLFPDGRLQSAGMVLRRDGTTSAPWFGEHPPPTAFDCARPVDYCGTSSLLVRSEIWDAIGGLDDRFYPVYYVDVDLAMAIRKLGRIVLYQPDSRIRHHSGASMSPRWRNFLMARNRRLFVEKWATELAQHESQEAVRAAVYPTALPSLPPPRLLSDSDYLEKERSVRGEYITQLEDSLDKLEHGLAAAELTARELSDLRAASVYLPGTRLAFSTDGNAYRFQCTGGLPPEEWGVWLDAEPLTIVLPLAAVGVDSTSIRRLCTLVLETVPFLAEGRPVSTVNVSVNGAVVAQVDETRPGAHRYDIKYSWTRSSRVDTLAITVRGCDPIAPASIGVNADTRPLSLGLVALTVVDGP